MPSEPVKHLPRWVPPWATARLTHCGKALTDVAVVGEFAEYIAIARKDGMKRAAYTYCVTCAERATSYEYQRVSRAEPLTWPRDARLITYDWINSNRDDLGHTLTALGILIERHREEFDGLIEGLDEVTDLDELRRRRKRGR